MNLDLLIYSLVAVILISLCALIVIKKKPKKLKVDQYVDKWKLLQSFCRDKATWPEAIIAADKLLDSALKRRKFKGKSMGERLVSAQRAMTNNDSIWFAHNLYKKIVAESETRLKEVDVKAALVAYRQALKDIGALPRDEPKDS